MEVSVDHTDRVFVRWHGGGPWLVLEPGGTVHAEPNDFGAEPWSQEAATACRCGCDPCAFCVDAVEADIAPAPRPIRTVNLPEKGSA